jgi:hypothetical protein
MMPANARWHIAAEQKVVVAAAAAAAAALPLLALPVIDTEQVLCLHICVTATAVTIATRCTAKTGV